MSSVPDMAGQCHLRSQKKHNFGAFADSSGTLVQARRRVVEQVWTKDKSLARSRTTEQETAVHCSDPDCRRGRPLTTVTARQLRSSSAPIRVTRDVNLRRASRLKYVALHTKHTSITKRISLASHRSANSPFCEAELCWSLTPLAVELRPETKTADSGETDQYGQYKVAPAHEPRRCCSDGGSAWEPASVNQSMKALITSEILVSREKDSCSSTAWDAGEGATAALPLAYVGGDEACAYYTAPSKSCLERRPSHHLFPHSNYGSIHSHTCCSPGETLSATSAMLNDVRTALQLSSMRTRRRRRGPRSLEAIPVGRVAAVKTELERRMQEEKQRRKRNCSSLRAFHSAEVSGVKDMEKMARVQDLTRAELSSADFHNAGHLDNVMEQNWMRTGSTSSQCTQQFRRDVANRAYTCGNVFRRVNSTTLTSGSDSSRAKDSPYKQNTQAAEPGDRPSFLPLFARVQVISERETANHTVLHPSSTSQPRGRMNSEYPAHQLSEKSDGKAIRGMYRSQSCEMKPLSEADEAHTACSALKAHSFDCLPINRTVPIVGTDRTIKRTQRRFSKEQRSSQFARAKQAEEEPTATSNTQIYQVHGRCETDGTCLTMLAETKQKTGINLMKPPVQQARSTEGLPYYKAAPTSERQHLSVSVDVSEDQRDPLCDAEGCGPSQRKEARAKGNGVVCVSSAKSATRRPPGVPRLELAKVHEAHNVLHPPLKVNASIGTPGRAPDSELTSCEKRKPHAYPSIRTEYCREVAGVRTADAYFRIDKRPSVSRSSGGEFVERQVIQDSLRQQQGPCMSQGLWAPARPRVVRCSPNLFTARVCTILRKQLYAGEVRASGARGNSQQTPKPPQPPEEGITTVNELGRPYSPAGKNLRQEVKVRERLCAPHSISRTLTQFKSSPLSQLKQHMESPCNSCMPSITYWSSSTRPSSSTSLVSSCSDPTSALDAIEEQQSGQAAPTRGKKSICARFTGAGHTNVLRRASRTLGGPQTSCHHSLPQSNTCTLLSWKSSDQSLSLPPNGGYDTRMNRTEGEATHRVRGSRRTAFTSEPPNFVLAESSCSPVSHAEAVRLVDEEHSKQGSISGSPGLQSHSTVCSIKTICDSVTEKADHLPYVPTLHQARNCDGHDHKVTTRCFQKHTSPGRNSAVNFSSCGSTIEKSTFLRRRRLALSRHKRSEAGYYSDVAEKLSNAVVAPSKIGEEIKQSSYPQYAGASFF